MAAKYPAGSPEAIAAELVRKWLLAQADVLDLVRRTAEAIRVARAFERAACAQIAEDQIGAGSINGAGGYDAACIDIFEAITARHEQERQS